MNRRLDSRGPTQDAVGERMKIAGTWATVVGVAADTRYRELTVLRPTAYRPRDQFEAAPPYLAVRTAGDPVGLAPAIRRAGEAMWPGATFSSLQRLDHFSTEPLARSRVTAALFVAFAAICLLLSTIGLYGVVTAQVADRTRDIGIRVALGAPRGTVLRAVLLEGAMLTLLGLMGGTAIAALLGGWLETLLYGVSRPRHRDDRERRGAHVRRDRCRDLHSCQTRGRHRTDGRSSRVVGDVQAASSPFVPAVPIDTSASPERTMYQ